MADGALAVIQQRYVTDLVSMVLALLGVPWAVQKMDQVSGYCEEEAGDWKDLQICDQLC